MEKGCEAVESKTQLAKLIELTNDKAKYDAQVKKILANKAILAWILKTCTIEFSAFSPKEIISCIEGEPEISTISVHAMDPDLEDQPDPTKQLPQKKSGEYDTLLDSDESITGSNTEDTGLKEQSIYYDIRFNVRVPTYGVCTSLQMIINIEAQLDTYPGYPIEKRAIYYCCRLISAQYGTVFHKSEYGKMRKAYSIWICADPAKKRRNTIKRIRLEQSAVYGSFEDNPKDIDLIQAIIINLGDPHNTENPILRLMGVLLSDTIGVHEKKKIMEEEFHIAMTMELESEVSELCNLSEGVYKKGLSNGMEQGLAQGLERGLEQGLERGIQGAVELLRESGIDDSTIMKNIMKKYQLSLEEAQDYVYATGDKRS